MTTVLFRRPLREKGPEEPEGELVLQEPPELPEPGGRDFSGMMQMLPMVAGTAVMSLFFIKPGSGGLGWLAGGMMGVAVVGMIAGQLIGGNGDRKRGLNGARRDYVRYLAQVRKQVRTAAEGQRTALSWRHPAPDALWTIAGGTRLWERRPTHPDFSEVRVGTGEQQLGLRLKVPQTRPVEDLEPLSAGALRRFVEAFDKVRDVPMALLLRSFARVLLRGSIDDTAGLARAIVAQLVTLHSPEDVRIAVLAADERLAAWDWVKWLPHAALATERDGAGPVRIATDSYATLEELLGDEELRERPRFDASATPSTDEPYILVIVDGVPLPAASRMLASGYRNLTVLDVDGSLQWKADRTTLRLDVGPDTLHSVAADRAEADVRTSIGRPDRLSMDGAYRLAKRVSPYRLGVSVEASDTLSKDMDLTQLLDIADPVTLDPRQTWSRRSAWDRLRVPIGLAEDGTPVELDIKESAQGGDGPHGMLIGATGSGKSELLRTLVIAMALTHSSETLNFVLVDFKGGATFLRLDQLPHTSAVITNLADELPLVDRMQDAIHGELVRRQELLRASEYSSALDYEKARATGAPLEPLPTLFLVIDEFSELLSVRRDFMDLFVMVGRLGRSLGVHLLLASQRLDEGRISQLESHLSYRIGLRTFSAVESRAVLGVPAAYELPSAPGNGYMKTDTSTLTRFKAAYVSGPWRVAERRTSQAVVQGQVAPFVIGYVAPTAPALPEPEPADPGQDDDAPRLLDVLIDRLRDVGPPARTVWVPPLAESPSLDRLLPRLVLDPEVGATVAEPAWRSRLRVPVGVIDNPFEQRRDLLVVDLGGAGGHVGVVGSAQSGKTTALRTLVTSLALTHTPREVQFYCLDFGGGGLTSLAALPHVGGVAGRLDAERVTRTVAQVTDVLAGREQGFAANGVESIAEYRRMRREGRVADPYGDLFLVVDGWFTLKEDFEPLETAFQLIASRGLGYGVHLVIAASRWMEMRPWLKDALGTRIELHLGDPIDSLVGSRQAANVPAVPGRGITAEGGHLLIGLPRADGGSTVDDLPDASRELAEKVAEAWPGQPATPVRTLPAVLPADDLPEPERGPNGDLRLPLGLDESHLAPVWHDFGVTPHLMVFGDAETGKTNLARLVARAIARSYTPEQARVMLADSRRGLYSSVPPETQLGYAVSGPALRNLVVESVTPLTARLPGPDVTPDRLPLRDWWTGPQLFIVIDDYELFGGSSLDGPLAPLMDLAPQGLDIGLHIVLVRSSSGGARAMMEPIVRRIWELATPALLLSTPRSEGAFLGDVRPRVLPVGRAQYLSRRGAPTIVQTGYVPER